jgi:hypothetical protein
MPLEVPFAVAAVEPVDGVVPAVEDPALPLDVPVTPVALEDAAAVLDAMGIDAALEAAADGAAEAETLAPDDAGGGVTFVAGTPLPADPLPPEAVALAPLVPPAPAPPLEAELPPVLLEPEPVAPAAPVAVVLPDVPAYAT